MRKAAVSLVVGLLTVTATIYLRLKSLRQRLLAQEGVSLDLALLGAPRVGPKIAGTAVVIGGR